MKLLFLAPQPFFQERGTPIAVRLALQVLTDRLQLRSGADTIDFLTYNEGQEVSLPGVTQYRIPSPSWLKGIGPGISLKKLLCDLILLVSALRLVHKNRAAKYDLVHAVEESAFIAWLIKRIYAIPFIYDMDSSLSLQLTEKWRLLKPLAPILEWFERQVVKESVAVVPVCDSLAVIADRHGSKFTSVLSDISLLKDDARVGTSDLREELSLPRDTLLLLYIGNLERYQGIDLLLESLALCKEKEHLSRLIVIGGRDDHVKIYTEKAAALGLDGRAFFLGPRPVGELDNYIHQADLLISPRTLGNNTPMKIYSYLHAGKAVLATRLPTHTQVLTPEIAMLAEPTPAAFSAGMLALINDQQLRQRLGSAAKKLAEERYTFDRFKERLNYIYDNVTGELLSQN